MGTRSLRRPRGEVGFQMGTRRKCLAQKRDSIKALNIDHPALPALEEVWVDLQVCRHFYQGKRRCPHGGVCWDEVWR